MKADIPMTATEIEIRYEDYQRRERAAWAAIFLPMWDALATRCLEIIDRHSIENVSK